MDGKKRITRYTSQPAKLSTDEALQSTRCRGPDQRVPAQPPRENPHPPPKEEKKLKKSSSETRSLLQRRPNLSSPSTTRSVSGVCGKCPSRR